MNERDDKLTKQLKYLRLTKLLAQWDEYLHLAADKKFSHGRFLSHVVEQEYKAKLENSKKLRLKRASVPEELVMETFPFERQPKLNKKKVLAIYDSLNYIKDHKNIILLGATGSGKTGLAISFLTQAINSGYTGKFMPFPELISELYRSVADHSEQQVLKRYLAYDLLVVDELGYIETEPTQVGLFFALMHKRHKKKSTIITSNLGFSEWGSFLKNTHLTAALIDRLTDDSYLINMKGCITLRTPPHDK